MKSTTRPFRAGLLILALAAMAACTENGGAIFATIEQEEKTVTSNLPDETTVQDVLEREVDGAPTFLAVARTLYLGIRDPDVTPPSNERFLWPVVANRLELDAGFAPAEGISFWSAVFLAAQDSYYAIIAVPQDDTEIPGLYRADATSILAVSDQPALDWSPVAPVVSWGSDESPEGLILVNNELFVVTRKSAVLPKKYGLYRYDAEANAADSALSALIAGGGTDVPAADGAFHASEYWFVAGTSVLRGAIGSIDFYSETAIASTPGYGGIHASGAELYLSSRAGRLFVQDGTTWTPSAADLTMSGDDAPLVFTDFVTVGSTVYVGSVGRGFFSLAEGLPEQADLANRRLPDRSISELYSGAILGFATSADGSVVFVRTAGAGLWHQVIDPDTTPPAIAPTGWKWE